MNTVADFAKSRIVHEADAVDLAIGQMLALAAVANVGFDVVDGRLAMRSAHMDWKLWPPVRRYLDEIGVAAIIDYFQRHGLEERAALSAAA